MTPMVGKRVVIDIVWSRSDGKDLTHSQQEGATFHVMRMLARPGGMQNGNTQFADILALVDVSVGWTVRESDLAEAP